MNAAISIDWAKPSNVTSFSVGRFCGAVVVVAADEESVGPVPVLGVVAPALPARNGSSETAAPPTPRPSSRRRSALSPCARSVTSMSTKKSFRDAQPQPSLPGVSGAILEVERRQVWYPSAGPLDGPCPLLPIELRCRFDDVLWLPRRGDVVERIPDPDRETGQVRGADGGCLGVW